ncbi:hypothetical protein BGZ95_004583 [Linnemannia exigua]|uniref:Uncharacterized protein n=1 Tax=Linnemannia exigua TaxID=604196 RepID=A0AAD4D2W5_9FUNG|nr:hypothetical protein BGZ95_004583 [Linnemannia exigua]
MSEEARSQSFQRGPAGRVVLLQAYTHADSGQHIVLWDDILDLFPIATSALRDNFAIPRARDSSSLRIVKPRCNWYQAGKVLKNVLAEELTSLHFVSPPSAMTVAAGTTAVFSQPDSSKYYSLVKAKWANLGYFCEAMFGRDECRTIIKTHLSRPQLPTTFKTLYCRVY